MLPYCSNKPIFVRFIDSIAVTPSVEFCRAILCQHRAVVLRHLLAKVASFAAPRAGKSLLNYILALLYAFFNPLHLAVGAIAAVMDAMHSYLGQTHTTGHLKAGNIALTRLSERGNWDCTVSQAARAE